jgi:hypothetical protein
MPIDAYTPCPGGSGKKVKFCCGGDFLAELQKIDRMVEGQQFLACLQYLDSLPAKERDRPRACLLATKCLLLRVTDQHEAAKQTAQGFSAAYPNNQVALAEMAIVTAREDALAAFDFLLSALEAADAQVEPRTYSAIGQVAAALLHEGFVLPARALLQLQKDIAPDDKRAQQGLAAICRSHRVPLLLRDEPPLSNPPADAPWKDRWTEAWEVASVGRWRTAAERFAQLAAEAPDAPAVWCDLATLRGWLAQNQSAIEALRKYAALRAAEPDGFDDAAEAEATAMFLSSDPFGDRLDVFRLVWTVRDAEAANERFLSSPLMEAMRFDRDHWPAESSPPPKAAYSLLDRPMPAAAGGLAIDALPRRLGEAALLFGRQTDCDARFELAVTADDRSEVERIVRETAGDSVEPEPKRDLVGARSASHKLMTSTACLPAAVSRDQAGALITECARDALLNRWPDLKLGVLDGRSPRAAAADPSSRPRLTAVVMVMESIWEDSPWDLDFAELRSRLGLPAPAPMELHGEALETLPAVRLVRLTVERLSDDELSLVFDRAGDLAIRPAQRNVAQAIIDRPSFADSEERLPALATMAQTEEDISEALRYCGQGRREAEAKGQSSVSWDLMELSFQCLRQNAPEVMRLVEHIQKRHINEPGVAEALMNLLVQLGLLHPDGTPAVGPEAAEPAMAAAAEPAAEPTKLWTPDSAQPGGGKLWTPE